jgi:alcohol dehydrogenase class IV
MQETGYKVVWPLGKTVAQTVKLAPRISDLNNKTICEVSDYGFRSEEIFPLVRKLLTERYPGIKFIEYTNFGNTHGPQETEVIATLAEKLHQYKCDAVISGVGG